MSFDYKNPSRGGKPTATSITTLQRSTCEAVFYRFDQSDITKLEKLNINNGTSLGGGGALPTQGNFKPKRKLIIQNDIVRCNITRNKGASSGNFSLTLKRGKQVDNGQVQSKDVDYLKAIQAGDWVMIYMKKSGKVDTKHTTSKSGLKFLGVVENVRYLEVDDPNKGSPKLEYVVTGKDFGKVLENEIFFNPTVNGQRIQAFLGAKFLTDSSNSVKGDNRADTSAFTPDTIIENLVSFYLGGSFEDSNKNNQTWYIPAELGRTFNPKARVKSGGVSFVDILNTDRIGIHQYDANNNFDGVTSMPGATVLKALPSSGTVWGILQFMQNAAVNEMYLELVKQDNGDLQPSLIHRQMPFSNRPKNETNVFQANSRFPTSGGNGVSMSDGIASDEKTFFTSLPRLTITSSKIKQKNVGKSDHERINHVIVVPKIDSGNYDKFYAAAFNVPSVQRYGLKSLQTQTSYVLDEGEGFKYLERCVNLLIDWFFLSHQLYNGTIIIDGVDEHVELGNNLYISDVKQLYHIEGYTHTYEINDSDGRILYTTELRVSRGQIFDKGKSSFIDSTVANKEPTTISTSVLEGIRK